MFKGNEDRYSNLRSVGYSGERPDPNDGPSSSELARQDEVQSVVVELLDASGKLPLSPWLGNKEKNVMHQHHKNFIPQVVAVPKGSQVLFVNEDPFMHHIYSNGTDPKGFEIPEHRQTVTVTQNFNEPGVLELFCGLHPRMNSYIYVARSSFVCQPGKDHQFQLNNVPPGNYRLRCWHPRYGQKELDVSVPEKGSVELNLSL